MARNDGCPGINPLTEVPGNEESHHAGRWRARCAAVAGARRRCARQAPRPHRLGLRLRRRLGVLPGRSSLATGGTKLVTIANTNNVVLDAGSSSAPTSAPRRSSSAPRRRSPRRATRTRPREDEGARVRQGPPRPRPSRPQGAVTLGAGQITVATLVFTSPTASPVAEGHRRQGRQGHRLVRRRGRPDRPEEGQAQQPSRPQRPPHRRTATASAQIAGRVLGLTAATATTPGSVMVGGITARHPGRQGAPPRSPTARSSSPAPRSRTAF